MILIWTVEVPLVIDQSDLTCCCGQSLTPPHSPHSHHFSPAMENILGHASNLSHSSGLISTMAKRSLGQRSSKLTTTPWICQRCYNHSQSNLRKAGNAYPLASRPRSIRQRNLSQLFFSTSQSLKHADEAKFEKRAARDDLPSHEESRRSHLSKKFSHVMDHLQSNIFTAGQRLNDLTGYSGIEALKKEIEEQGKGKID